MNILNNGTSEISAKDANIIARFEDAELVAVLHVNGFMGMYAEDGELLIQVSNLQKPNNGDYIAHANKMMGV
jgi:hypothetical protein